MKQEQLHKFLDSKFPIKLDGKWVVAGHKPHFSKELLEFINQHISEIIGEDEIDNYINKPRNNLREEQRKKAGIGKEV